MKKNIVFLVFALSLFSVVSIAQDAPLATINGKKISKSAFEYIYNKNNSSSAIDKKSLDEYLDLFVTFKLKVAEAETQGLDTVKSYVSELAGYRRQLAAPYLTDVATKDKLIKEAYERMKEDIDVSHILIKVDEKSSPADTLIAYIKALEALKKLKKENFETVAREMSDDPSVKQNGGHLGFMSALWTVYPFETAAYNTPVGKLSKPIRTMFGYHIIQVNGRRPARGKVMVAHIMKFTNDTVPGQNEKAEKEIKDLYARVKAGEDFGKLAKENSDDKYSAEKNGELPLFGSGNMVKDFEDASFALTEIGQISAPVKTQYGWHIIKLLEKKPIDSFDQAKGEIEKQITRGDRAEIISSAFTSNLKKEYNYTVDKKALSQLESLNKSNQGKDSLFYVQGSNLNGLLFSFGDKKYTQAQLVAYMKEKKQPVSSIEKSLNIFSNGEIFNYEDSRLAEKYPDFKNIMQEYRDGILLFNVSNKEVWERASQDTIGIHQFFQNNKANYTWDAPRYKGRVLYCNDQKTAKQVKLILKSVPADSIDNRLKVLNKKNIVVKSEKGLFAKGANKAIDLYVFKTGDFVPEKDFSIVFVEGRLLSNPEDYLDIRGSVTQDYQTYLEKEWVKTLKAKYPVSINEEVLKTVKKN